MKKQASVLQQNRALLPNWRLSKINCIIVVYMLITNHSHLIMDIMEILEIMIEVVSCMWAFKFIA